MHRRTYHRASRVFVTSPGVAITRFAHHATAKLHPRLRRGSHDNEPCDQDGTEEAYGEDEPMRNAVWLHCVGERAWNEPIITRTGGPS
jgi:hypothetical protein